MAYRIISFLVCLLVSFNLAMAQEKSTTQHVGPVQLETESNELKNDKGTSTRKNVTSSTDGTSRTDVQQKPTPGESSDAAELSKKLANPVSSLVSFPIQTNFDFRMGTGSGWRMTTNVQPVIPISLNKDWNLISRTIVPIIYQGNVTGPDSSQV